MVRRPITSDREGTSKANTQLDIAAIVSGAVVEGLKVAGIFKDTQGNEKEAANPAVSVQESVAAVIQDITGENNPPLIDSNNSIGSNSLVTQHMAEANDRPQILHTQIGVPLASRISEKIQSKIWANEYIDLGTLLHRTSPSDYKYNFVVQTTQSNDRPVISLEPAQKAKRIIAIDQWITAFQTFVAIYTVRFPKDAPALMKYSETVRDLAAKNAHWRYYDENSRFLRQRPDFTQGNEKEAANPAVSVQESVAAVIQDITGENNPPLIDSNNSIGTNSLVTQHMAEANDRPQILHTQIGVPLASRIFGEDSI